MNDADEENPPPARPLDYAGPPDRDSPVAGWPTERRGCGIAVGILLVLLLAGMVILPSLGGAPRQAGRIACAANLRSVGQSLALYAAANGGRFPDTVEQLYLSGEVTDVRIFVCPACGQSPARGATTQQVAANLAVGGHVSFVYAGAGLTTDTARADTVVMYEPLSNHAGDGGNVLFGDGYVRWYHRTELPQLVIPTTRPTSAPATSAATQRAP